MNLWVISVVNLRFYRLLWTITKSNMIQRFIKWDVGKLQTSYCQEQAGFINVYTPAINRFSHLKLLISVHVSFITVNWLYLGSGLFFLNRHFLGNSNTYFPVFWHFTPKTTDWIILIRVKTVVSVRKRSFRKGILISFTSRNRCAIVHLLIRQHTIWWVNVCKLNDH